MKLSELKTDEALDVLCEITPPIISILADESLMAELKRKAELDEHATKAEYLAVGAAKITTLLPIILKDHRDDVYAILSSLNGKTKDEIAKQPIFDTAFEIRDIVRDKDLLDFFSSFSPKE